MALKIYITKNYNQMSQLASKIVELDILTKLNKKKNYILGLATGNSPVGLYKNLSNFFNKDKIDTKRIITFNLDEYVGLKGENAQQRTLNEESYSYFMIEKFFSLLKNKFYETNLPWGNLIDQNTLIKTLKTNKNEYEIQGTNNGKAIVIKNNATGILKKIKKEILIAYEKKIKKAGGIDLHIIGTGEKGHIAFHESGIPFKNNKVILVKLDKNTINNSILDGHFRSLKDAPKYAVSMGVELVYQADTVLLLANGNRKATAIYEAVLGKVSNKCPASYSQKYAEKNKNMILIADKEAGKYLLNKKDNILKKGYEYIEIYK